MLILFIPKVEIQGLLFCDFTLETPVLAKETLAGWVPSQGEGIQKHAQQFLKQAGGDAL